MDLARVTASDIVREAEVRLVRSASMREEARRLLESAAALDADTLAMAIEALGEGPGQAAYGLAAISIEASKPAMAPTPSKDKDSSNATDCKPPESGIALPPVETAERVEARIQAKEVIYGVSVPASRRSEAESIVAEARGAAAQGKKLNPYLADRGKNAWRASLFRSVLSTASLPGEAAGDEPVRSSKIQDVLEPSGTVAFPTTAHPPDDPLDDLPPQDSPPSLPDDAGAAALIDLPPERLESHPVPSTRRAGFNNSVPKPPGLTEALSRAGVSAPLLSRPGRRPSFLKR